MAVTLPNNESGFYQLLKEETLGSMFWERLELETDSGFPDSHFVVRRRQAHASEGTIEFKWQRNMEEPVLKKLMRGEQKANFIDYATAGGRRRFVLVGNMAGSVFLYSTDRVVEHLRGFNMDPSSVASWEDEKFPVRHWLPSILAMDW